MMIWLRQCGFKSETLLAICIIMMLMLLFVPVPTVILDILIILNISIALMILLLTLYSDRPLDFSTLPSVLLLATLFRLGISISSTRLILVEGDAGKVISSVGNYVVAGNYVVGLVVFFILVVVQFIVVTNGAQRVAEVAARFTLDSMPGKQMSIDADLNMGIINEKQAQVRRDLIEREANFYGAMDGATKFVKGDAVANIIIILINIIGGLSIGIAQAGMSWEEALHVYTLQTVGDGIVTQIPSLIIAVGTGIIITRAATQGNLAGQLVTQIISHPVILMLVAVVIGSAAFLPGLPTVSLVLVAIAFTAMSYLASRSKLKAEEDSDETETHIAPEPADTALSLVVHRDLLEELADTKAEIIEQYNKFKAAYEQRYGLLLPDIAISASDRIGEHEYVIKVNTVELAAGRLYPALSMVIDPEQKLDATHGIKTTEPAYGLPAVWLPAGQASLAKKQGYMVIAPTNVLTTHLTEFVKTHAAEFVSRNFIDQLVSEQRDKNESLLTDVIPAQLAVADLQGIVVALLQERVAIHNMMQVFEVLADKARSCKDVVMLTEWVRQRLRNQITGLLLDPARTLHVISVAPALERILLNSAAAGGLQNSGTLTVAPNELEFMVSQLSTFVEKAIVLKIEPVLLVTPSIRRPVWQLLNRIFPQLHVLSLNEIGNHIKLNSLGVAQARSVQAA